MSAWRSAHETRFLVSQTSAKLMLSGKLTSNSSVLSSSLCFMLHLCIPEAFPKTDFIIAVKALSQHCRRLLGFHGYADLGNDISHMISATVNPKLLGPLTQNQWMTWPRKRPTLAALYCILRFGVSSLVFGRVLCLGQCRVWWRTWTRQATVLIDSHVNCWL